MTLSFRRVAGRVVLAAGVCAAAILVVRGDEAPPDRVTYVIDPRPLGDALRHVDVTIAVGDEVSGWQTREVEPSRPVQPLRLVTPTPAGAVTITLDVVTTAGPRRVVHHAAPTAGSTVEITLGRAE